MVLGLPLHPLLVHFAVVFLLGAGGAQLLAVLLPRFRVWLGWGVPALALVAAVTVKITQHYGEELELSRNLSSPEVLRHAAWGGRTAWVAIALAVVAVLHWIATAPQARARWSSAWPDWLRIVIAVVAAVVSLAAIITVTVTGHLGAVAVWGG